MKKNKILDKLVQQDKYKLSLIKKENKSIELANKLINEEQHNIKLFYEQYYKNAS